MPRFFSLLVLLLSPLNLWATSAKDSEGLPVEGETQIRFEAKLIPNPVRVGERARMEIALIGAKGWHVYSVFPAPEEDAPPPTKLAFEALGLEADGPAYETAPLVQFDQVIQLTLSTHEERSVFYQNFLVKGLPGERSVKVAIKYQVCSFRVCLPPAQSLLVADYQVEPGPPRAQFLNADRSVDTLPESGRRINKGLGKEGFWAFIGLAAFMGLASLITPCVFPMVPITISYFSKQADGNPAKLFGLATLFGGGIVATYTGTGLILSWIFGAGAASQLATNPWVNLTIALVFILFSFSLMGAFNIRLPAQIEGYFDAKARATGGALGVVLMGFTFTLTAFTCTVQFVGTLMIAAAQGQMFWPLLGMIVFSSVFAFPFFLLALAPGLVGKMHRGTGQWLGRAKWVLGMLELMASIKFLSNADLVWQTGLISRDLNLQVWMALLGLIIGYLIFTGFRQGRFKSPVQLAWVGFFVLLLVLTSQGLGGRSLGSLIDSVLPPAEGRHLEAAEYASEEEIKSLVWMDNLEAAQALALSQKKPIFLEFTGYTCVNCRWMEQNVLAQKAIYIRLKERYILVRLFTDGGPDKDRNLALQINRFQTVALPLYLILTPQGQEQGRYIGLALAGAEFAAFLDKAP